MRSARWYLSLCLAGLAAWVVLGASCPPPRTPVFFEVIPDTDTDVDTPLPSCIDGFVCISFKNSATIPVRMALYRHDGFEVPDEIRLFLTECCDVSFGSPCPCECEGEREGECLLTPDQLFDPVNLDTISGSTDITLAPEATVLKRVRCNQVKTLGAALSGVEQDPTMEPSDQLGPAFRDEPSGAGVASFECGGTIQFSAEDINEADEDNPDLAQVVLQVQTSD